jgi:hypothetical protein
MAAWSVGGCVFEVSLVEKKGGFCHPGTQWGEP